jgi:hypothetical protein
LQYQWAPGAFAKLTPKTVVLERGRVMVTTEQQRLNDARQEKFPWKKWGPYLSERQWGTVREDYSEEGDAWNYFTHDQARSRAYRWGEDGLAGISDDKQHLCFALALWNGKDPILKERLFGLTNSEGNHGEDVKEYYFYLDSTPTHSYMKYLYKYPQAVYPYADLLETNRCRSKNDMEYELLDTGVFNDDRYFDVFVEYAKESPEDILISITAYNRGPEPAELHVLPTLWFRNTWSGTEGTTRPRLSAMASNAAIAMSEHPELGVRYLYCDGEPELLFTENETNAQRLFGVANRSPYVKDGINNYVVNGQADAVNLERKGTKVAAHYRLTVPPGESQLVQLRLSDVAPAALPGDKVKASDAFGSRFEFVFDARRKEADEFYAAVIPGSLNLDAANVMRQALAGMLWGKQFYNYNMDKWLLEHGCTPFKEGGKTAPRNERWDHMYSGDVISMPDKWEYPWFAAWDLAFHVIAISLVDVDFAKDQLQLMLSETYMHPDGQIPAYEWNFGDVNPPVLAWATNLVYTYDRVQNGETDTKWLKACFHKLCLDFAWWVNRKDRHGKNVFEGGFLGLDNIGVFDRSSALPTGGHLEQADGTAWMALYADNMLQMAIQLAQTDEDYEGMVLKFLQHDAMITASLASLGGGIGMWDEEDGFLYDVLRLPDGQAQRLKTRSMVGLLPLCAATSFEQKEWERFPKVSERFRAFMEARPHLRTGSHDSTKAGSGGRHLFAVLDETKLRRVLAKMLDPNEFLSPCGIRSISRYHADHPYVYHVGGQEYRVGYLPAESDTGMFGGNSNWRGPIWMPVNVVIVRALLSYFSYYGNDFTVECPTGSGQYMNLYQVAQEITRRLTNIFLKDEQGRRPVYGGIRKFQEDPHWRDLVLFHEYFHGDNGAGLGASHQTGWTGTIARLMHLFATTTEKQVLELGLNAATVETKSEARSNVTRPAEADAQLVVSR